ncbi:hypothetical protein P775_27220 [Puniceibacterium antarcticum]|uniref:Uncharacterized protein n=1 Tax=Puniceibacterium antarcticum TaxID=1206336 RepID=A0A2G8QWJ7_9RHOB|nr:hypothetical protein P775_27220 [Puniceibacterium antarcticum]
MNPVGLPIGASKIAQKRRTVEAAGVLLPPDMDDETFCQTFGIGSTILRPGKEMEAIRATNFLTNNDPSGAQWITFNRTPTAADVGAGGRRRRG